MAAEKVGSIYYDLDLDDTKFRKGMKSTDGLMKSAEKGSMALLTGITALGIGLGALGVSALDSANDMDKASLKYEVLLGSAEAAQQRVKELTDFADRTPFELKGVTEADILLQGFGIRSEELLTIIGDAAAISETGFRDLSLIIGQLSQSKDLENIKQLVERGIVSFDELRNAGIRFAKDGSVVNSVEETYGAVVSIMENKFGGGMAELANTLEGRISTLGDNFRTTIGQMAKDSGLVDIAKEAITRLSTALEGITWDDIKTKIDELQPTLVILGTTVLFALVPAFWGLATAVWAALAPLLPFIAAGVIFGVIINKLVEYFGGWEPLINKVKESLQKIWDLVSPWLIPAFQEMKRVIVEELWPALQDLWNQVSPVLLPALKILAVIIGGVLITALYAAIKIVTWLARELAAWAKSTGEKVTAVKQWFIDLQNNIKTFAHNFIIKFVEIRSQFGAFVTFIVGKINELRAKLVDLGQKAKDALDKINPFHRESPSLVDWVTKGTGEISGMYDDMFAKIGDMTAEGRVNLMSGAKASENITSPTSINISLNPSGIIARSSGELRDVARDMLDAINEDLQSRGINMLGK